LSPFFESVLNALLLFVPCSLFDSDEGSKRLPF